VTVIRLTDENREFFEDWNARRRQAISKLKTAYAKLHIWKLAPEGHHGLLRREASLDILNSVLVDMAHAIDLLSDLVDPDDLLDEMANL
jgi:hypothetical protein